MYLLMIVLAASGIPLAAPSLAVGAVSAERRVDPVTGAPVPRTGIARCRIRLDASGEPVGPDGVARSGDEGIPSDGNCLYWLPPTAPGEPQSPRPTDQVAALQPIDLEGARALLGPLACLRSFGGRTLFSELTEPQAALLGLLPGSSRSNPNHVAPLPGSPAALASPSTRACAISQLALVGQGPATGCLSVPAGFAPVPGLNLLWTDASVLSQEWFAAKLTQAGAPVAPRALGVNLEPSTGTFHEAGIATATFAADPANEPCVQRLPDGGFASDSRVEPWPWRADPDGLIRPLGDDGIPKSGDEPRALAGGENCTPAFGGPDPGCTTLELISANFERAAITDDLLGHDAVFDPPETAREALTILRNDPSAFLRGDPISGPDGIVFADWIAPDGSGASSDVGLYGFRSDQPDLPIRVDLSTYQRAIEISNPGRFVIHDDFQGCANDVRVTRRIRPQICLRALGPPVSDSARGVTQLVGALPLSIVLDEVLPDGTIAPVLVALQQLSPAEDQNIASLQRQVLLGPRGAVVESSLLLPEVDPSTGELARDPRSGALVRRTARVRIRGRGFGMPELLDLDVFLRLQFNPLDENGDGQLDFLDDGTPGPVADDSLFCGSGLVGDVLQDAPQLALLGPEREILDRQLGEPLPPRRPELCRSPSSFLLELAQRGADDALHFPWQGAGESEDMDGDAIDDSRDDCPFAPDPDQPDVAGIGSRSGPDGVGDACQCGDANDDGRVDEADVREMRMSLGGLSSMASPEKCSVIGDRECDLADAIVLQRALRGMSPGIRPVCSRARP